MSTTLAEKVLPKRVSKTERAVLRGSVTLFSDRGALDRRLQCRDAECALAEYNLSPAVIAKLVECDRTQCGNGEKWTKEQDAFLLSRLRHHFEQREWSQISKIAVPGKAQPALLRHRPWLGNRRTT